MPKPEWGGFGGGIWRWLERLLTTKSQLQPQARLAGILWTAFSPTAAFAYLTAWMLLALAGLIRTLRR